MKNEHKPKKKKKMKETHPNRRTRGRVAFINANEKLWPEMRSLTMIHLICCCMHISIDFFVFRSICYATMRTALFYTAATKRLQIAQCNVGHYTKSMYAFANE